MGSSLVPGAIDGSRPVFIEQPLPSFGNFAAALVAAKEDLGFGGVVVDGADAGVLGWLTGRRDHDRLSLRPPHSVQGREATDVEFSRIIKVVSWLHAGAGSFDRLFLTRYSGSGRLILGCGRLSTISGFARCKRTVSASTRMPVTSAS